MEIPLRFAGFPVAGLKALAVLSLGVMLASCAGVPLQMAPVGLDAPKVEFNSGRVTVELLDEYGTPMSGYKVDFSWQKPNFYRTSAFTNSVGQVTFAGVPEIAEISIFHDGGLYEQTVLVPQRSRTDMRVMVDTLGGYEARRIEEELRRQRQATTAAR